MPRKRRAEAISSPFEDLPTSTNLTCQIFPSFGVSLKRIQQFLDNDKKQFTNLRLLDLPTELLYRICMSLDYRSLWIIRRVGIAFTRDYRSRILIDFLKTCRTIHDILNDGHFWEMLSSHLNSRPGIHKPQFEDPHPSISELRKRTSRALYAHDKWLSLPSTEQKVRTSRHRVKRCVNDWFDIALLPGGKWLFVRLADGTARMVRWNQNRRRFSDIYAIEGFRLKNTGDFLPKANLWIRREGHDTHSLSAFRMALPLVNTPPGDVTTSRIHIYQIDQVQDVKDNNPKIDSMINGVFSGSLVAQIRYYPFSARTGNFLTPARLSENYFVQCYCKSLEEGNIEKWKVRLHRYTNPVMTPTRDFVERDVKSEVMPFLLPHDRLGLVTGSSIEVLTIDESNTRKPPVLEPLHSIEAELSPCYLSSPLTGSQATYVLGLNHLDLDSHSAASNEKRVLRRVTLDHDTSFPVIEDLGNLELSSSPTRWRNIYGPLASVFLQAPSHIEVVTYDLLAQHSPFFERRRIKVPKLGSLEFGNAEVIGLDDLSGRLVLCVCNAIGDKSLLVVDLK
ncbi:hypothetical protein NP233_g9634 [Leucocoprinus birnbaumii]|uniref:F-box domain-containing protein n=1 Tax=Leucocoprinus birnbaumii TaxID=56174 RepID=A0AAD5VNK2_9AGAR|nr:hypothetical protein NP233_g9634 [Leucocoprinus birnbaumii]